MSHQPSTLDQIKTTATQTASSLQSSVTKETDPNYNPEKDPQNFAKDAGGNKVRKGGLKDALNEAAYGKGEGKKVEEEGLIATVKSYIPGLATTKTEDMEREKEREMNREEERRNGTPPRRPEHDVQVEQFLRGQYHSKSGDGLPDVGEQ